MPWGMLYAAHLAQGHFQDPPETDLRRDRAPHGDQPPSTNLSDIKQWAEEECKTYISPSQVISASETVSLSLSCLNVFYSSLYCHRIPASKPDVKLIVLEQDMICYQGFWETGGHVFEICTSELCANAEAYIGAFMHAHTHLLFFSMRPGGNFRGA